MYSFTVLYEMRDWLRCDIVIQCVATKPLIIKHRCHIITEFFTKKHRIYASFSYVANPTIACQAAGLGATWWSI